jgi:hypothetical protein
MPSIFLPAPLALTTRARCSVRKKKAARADARAADDISFCDARGRARSEGAIAPGTPTASINSPIG